MDERSSMSDERLFIRYARGDTGAFRILMERYSGRLLRFCRGYVGSVEEAEDVVQETFLRAVRSAPTYRTTARFSTWIHTIARNQCLDRLKVARRRRELWEQHRGELEEATAGSMETISGIGLEGAAEGTIGDIAPEQVREALERLTPAERETVRLTFFADWSSRRIADLQGCSPATVRVRRHQAIKRLRSLLGVEGPGAGLRAAGANGHG
jgi:RNA polymerase sigma-70 factor (ECF subfamily)